MEGSEEGDSNMYVHHDIVIPAFPLCLAWLDCPLKEGEKGMILLSVECAYHSYGFFSFSFLGGGNHRSGEDVYALQFILLGQRLLCLN